MVIYTFFFFSSLPAKKGNSLYFWYNGFLEMYFFVAKCSVEHIPATLCKIYISFASSSVNSKQQ